MLIEIYDIILALFRDCPEELKEAIASLIYVSTRCGDFPELLEIRAIFGSRFGREFVGRAVELRNNCGVNPKVGAYILYTVVHNWWIFSALIEQFLSADDTKAVGENAQFGDQIAGS